MLDVDANAPASAQRGPSCPFSATLRMRALPLPSILLLTLASASALHAQGGVSFAETSTDLGPGLTGPSFGAGSWGDINDDGWPDLWLNVHGQKNRLYLSQCDGTFIDYFASRSLRLSDTHGAMWGDFDGDGNSDIMEVTGAAGLHSGLSHRLVRIDFPIFSQEAGQRGVAGFEDRGRTPLWLDWNRDGRLDLAIANYPGSVSANRLFAQDEKGSFVAAGLVDGFDAPSLTSRFVQATDLTDDGIMEVVYHGFTFPSRVYDVSKVPMERIVGLFRNIASSDAQDAVFADFNGDLRSDLYLARFPVNRMSDAGLRDPNTAFAKMRSDANEIGMDLDAAGLIEFTVGSATNPDRIVVGSGGFKPGVHEFTLDRNDPSHQGLAPHTPGVDRGIFIGYDLASSRWQVRVSSSGSFEVWVRCFSQSPILSVSRIGYGPPIRQDDTLSMRGYVRFIGGDVDLPVSGVGVSCGDFDNDMDLDLYVVLSEVISDLPNVIYLNNGDGTFTLMPGAGGAAGDASGIGDGVSVVDYDMDGFLDLFLTHGAVPGNFATDGTLQLFRNLGNSNHWLEIDLEGTADNRDGYGATVYVTAGGVTQVREAGGGMHYATQDHPRLHFGLGAHTQVEKIRVQWPDGNSQEILDLPADQLLRIHQPDPRRVQGAPTYQSGVDTGAWIWKEHFDGPYFLRVSSADPLDLEIAAVADHPLTAGGWFLSGSDVLTTTSSGARLSAQVFAGEKGLILAMPAAAQLLVDLRLDDKVLPQRFRSGAAADPMQLAGWVVPSTNLRLTGGTFTPDLGLSLRSHSGGAQLKAVWDGYGGVEHRSKVAVFSAETPLAMTATKLEADDVALQTPSGIVVTGTADAAGTDLIEIDLPGPTDLGILWQQDSLFQPHRVSAPRLGKAGAVLVPRSTPYGDPLLDPNLDRVLALWNTENSGDWFLRLTGGTGGGFPRFSGVLASDQPLMQYTEIDLEGSDVLDTQDPYRIVFDFETISGRFDGVDLVYPVGTILRLEQSVVTGAEPPLAIGAERWPVLNLPLDLAGW